MTGQPDAARRLDRRGCAGLCSGAVAAGVGLLGEYFPFEDWRGTPVLVRLDGSIDLDAPDDGPLDRTTPAARSVRWTGWVKPPMSGRYRFHADVPGARVLVSRRLVGGADAQPDIELAAGRFYPITVEVSRITPGKEAARVRLDWTPPHGVRFAVPRALLYAPAESVVPPAT
jgi:hypothetical protein